MKELIKGRSYGTNAQNIYIEGCNSFSWDISKIEKFGMRRPLYAKDSAEEGISVWFLAHSNWMENDHINHKNFIYPGEETIKEYYFNNKRPDIMDQTNRLVFAKKKKDGRYYFIGIFKIIEQTNQSRVYKRTHETYPSN